MKILHDYCISLPLCGKTWRDSARLFSISNMINMGKEWINGMTYKELLDEADSRGKESLLYLNHIKNEYFEEALEVKDSIDWFYIDIDDMEKELLMDNIDTTEEQRVKIADVLTIEFGVISASIATRYYPYPSLPYIGILPNEDDYPNQAAYTGNMRKSIEGIDIVIDEMFDYMPYIMEFSYNNAPWHLYSVIYPVIFRP